MGLFSKNKSQSGEAGTPFKSAKKVDHYKSPGFLKKIGLAMAHMGLGKFRSAFIQNLAMMLGAGLQVIGALDTLEKEAQKKPMKKLIEKIHQDVENGTALWRAMDHQAFFTPYTIALVRIGEESGSLAENLENLAKQDEKDQAMKQKVKMAMIYPSIVIFLTVVIALGLSWFILPQLVGVLFALNVELPPTTRAVIAISEFFTNHGIVVVPSTFGLMLVVGFFMKFTSLKIVGQWFSLQIPGVKSLIKHASVARFGIILGSLLEAGVAPVEALTSLANVTSMWRYKKFYFQLTEHIKIGDSFAKSFSEIKNSKSILPVSVQQIIVTGEQSGRLSDVLAKISDIYQKKAEETAQKLPIILEPMLLIVIAGMVSFIAFSIIMPIYSVVGNLSG
ncbi:type II secretion system F family protein [Candidatus Peribacteria bacterium]|jgi:type IV pilus assembly protein PilC|nr:type II secretion system F family protein [Candidatus Peribacteria bacterium]MBT4021710.1 type II secretion system F family protein [Candidatus Peribacteria bacterium]MBT4241173.1 type II secretion system F family protein [Candidatus Peribacteria bacterium]MBT4473926.1 type II secretion system F family protein [Candidatus Peribacteria bacterium]